jgi:DNA-binding protein YbaB
VIDLIMLDVYIKEALNDAVAAVEEDVGAVEF